MDDNSIKIKFNVSLIKWGLIIFFLVGNLTLFLLGKCETINDLIIIIATVLSCNVLAALSFILLSIFPKWYYVFDNSGVRFFMNKKEKAYIQWANVVHAQSSYAFDLIFEGLQLKYKQGLDSKILVICISQKSIQDICQHIPAFNDIVHGNYIS